MRLIRRKADRQPRRPTGRVLIAGIGRRDGTDAAAGLIAADRMADENWPDGINVADLGEGGREALDKLRRVGWPYDRLVLLAAVRRGRAPGRVYSYHWAARRRREGDEQAGAVDEFLAAAEGQRLLPEDVGVIELELDDAPSGDGLSERARRLLPEMMRRAQRAALERQERVPAAPVGVA